MQKFEGRQRIRGGDLNATTLRKGYSISTKSHLEEVHNQFQEFIKKETDHYFKLRHRHAKIYLVIHHISHCLLQLEFVLGWIVFRIQSKKDD